VNLVDSHYCADASKFIAVMLSSVTTMLQLELPAINVLSKIDLIEQYGELRTCEIVLFHLSFCWHRFRDNMCHCTDTVFYLDRSLSSLT